MADQNQNSGGQRRCLVTGASGYLGSRIKARLVADGWDVVELGRHTTPGTDSVRFQLGEPISAKDLAGCFALVHCAYDFNQISRDEIWAKNVRGSELLLRAAKEAGTERIVYISSISAFEGCKSLYGQAKLEVEQIAQSLGGWTIRPGLVFGSQPGAAFRKLIENVQRAWILPIPGSGKQRTNLVHEDDLSEAVLRCLARDRSPSAAPVTVAHKQLWSFRAILLEIAKALDRNIVLVPIPWRLIWAGLWVAERLRVPIGLRSDSLVSLVHQNPRPLINVNDVLGVRCRPFAAPLLREAG